MQHTIGLLKIVGSPFASEVKPPKDNRDIIELYDRAQRNRMPLLYLMALKKWGQLGALEKVYEDMYKESLKTFDAFSRVAKILDKASVPYALFKTIRPYQSTTVDIDVLIIKSNMDYEKSIKAMVEADYKKLGSGPNSTTVKDPFMNMGVDLYREVAVSQIIYLDKDKIGFHIIEKMLPNGETVRSLSPSADLVSLIAHSVIKEHMYTLSEYYSTLYFLAQMNTNGLMRFIEIIRENAIVNAAKVHIGITSKLHEAAHGNVPEKVEKITEELGVDDLEIKRIKKSLETPHKFHPITVAKTMFEKTKRDEKRRRSIAKQIMSMLNPHFSKTLIEDLLN